MKIYWIIFCSLLMLTTLVACEKQGEIDKVKPVIDVSIPEAFPVSCDTLYFGEPFDLRLLFTDNKELGSYSIDIHNNFNHHAHSTEVTTCTLDPVKEPVNPYVFIGDYSIPTGQTNYKSNQSILIPAGNDKGAFDEGEYHFFIRLPDKEGWSAQKGFSIKMLHR